MKSLPHKFALRLRSISRHKLWVAGAGIGLTVLHLVLTWRLMRQPDQLVINALFWFAILGTLAVQSHTPPPGKHDRRSLYSGLVLLGLLVAKSLSMAHVEAWFVRLFPLIAVLTLGLLLSGFQLKQHWRTVLLVMPLMVPRGMVEHACEQAIGQPLQVMTAQLATFVLHYVGFNAVQQQQTITVNHSAVEVLFRCTGVPLLILLLQLALLFFVLFPLPHWQRGKVILFAVSIAFLFSGMRVALMAVVVKDLSALSYWHDGDGSQLFSTGAIVLFGWFCQQSLR